MRISIRRSLGAFVALIMAVCLGVVGFVSTAAAKGKPTPPSASCPAGGTPLAAGTLTARGLTVNASNADVSVSLTSDKASLVVAAANNGTHTVSSFNATVLTAPRTFDPALDPGQSTTFANPVIGQKGKAAITAWVVCGGIYVPPTPDPTPTPVSYKCVFSDANFEATTRLYTFNHTVDGVSQPAESQSVDPAQSWTFHVTATYDQSVHAVVTYSDPNSGTPVTAMDVTVRPGVDDDQNRCTVS